MCDEVEWMFMGELTEPEPKQHTAAARRRRQREKNTHKVVLICSFNENPFPSLIPGADKMKDSVV